MKEPVSFTLVKKSDRSKPYFQTRAVDQLRSPRFPLTILTRPLRKTKRASLNEKRHFPRKDALPNIEILFFFASLFLLKSRTKVSVGYSLPIRLGPTYRLHYATARHIFWELPQKVGGNPRLGPYNLFLDDHTFFGLRNTLDALAKSFGVLERFIVLHLVNFLRQDKCKSCDGVAWIYYYSACVDFHFLTINLIERCQYRSFGIIFQGKFWNTLKFNYFHICLVTRDW